MCLQIITCKFGIMINQNVCFPSTVYYLGACWYAGANKQEGETPGENTLCQTAQHTHELF